MISLQKTKIPNHHCNYPVIDQFGIGLWIDIRALGLPALGFNGAAYASIISEFLGMLTVIAIIYGLDVRRRFNIIPDFKIKLQTIRLVFTQGFPLMSQLAISTGSWWVFLSILVSRNYTYEEQAVFSDDAQFIWAWWRIFMGIWFVC
ncbi:MAG: hypothetical protein IPG00_03125 [Saprospiraceae bacterium]|nr:hypothetical protein [Saprospiraceae bacterium]